MRSKLFISALASSFFLAVFVFAELAALADTPFPLGTKRTHAILELGAGAETQATASTAAIQNMNLVLKLEAGIGLDNIYHTETIVAHTTGMISVLPDPSGAIIPYLDLVFTPIAFADGKAIHEQGGAGLTRLGFLEADFKRNMRIGQGLNIRVSLVDIQGGWSMNPNHKEAVRLYLNLALNAIGYEMASRTNVAGDFHGGHIAGTQLEVGARFQIAKGFSMNLALGGAADMNVGRNLGSDAVTIRSNMRAYAQLNADIKNFVRLFLRGEWDAVTDNHMGQVPNDFRIMSGITLFYNR